MAAGRLFLGSRIRALREEAHVALADASASAGISYSYLSDVERGRRLPTLQGVGRHRDRVGYLGGRPDHGLVSVGCLLSAVGGPASA